MDQQTTKDKKSFLRNDPLLVCGMLVIYGVCILGLIGVTFWGLDRMSKRISADATSMAFALATERANVTAAAATHIAERANVTATAIARTTEQADYGFIDHFYGNSGRWLYGTINNEYWVGSKNIQDGVYVWDVDEVKQTFISWEDFYRGENSRDFDAYVDAKIVEGNPGEVCSGLIFRKSPDGWDSGAYTFSVCNDYHFEVSYHGQDGWEDLSGGEYSNAIHSSDWNRIQVSARGDHFTLSINNAVVFKMIDDRQEAGGLAIFIELKAENPAVIWFDNFGYQSR